MIKFKQETLTKLAIIADFRNNHGVHYLYVVFMQMETCVYATGITLYIVVYTLFFPFNNILRGFYNSGYS